MTSPFSSLATQEVPDVLKWASERIVLLEQVKDAQRKVQKAYQKLGKSWEEDKDARAEWFLVIEKDALFHAQCDLLTLRDGLASKEWWRKNFKVTHPEAFGRARELFETRARRSLLRETHGITEVILRRLCEAVDPAFYHQKDRKSRSVNRGSIAKITEHLFGCPELAGYKELFKLVRAIRNTIHTNGVFEPTEGGNQTVQWKGCTYMFQVGEPVAILYWEFILQHIQDLNDAMRDLVLHPSVVDLPLIPRGY